jgi:MFS family permease
MSRSDLSGGSPSPDFEGAVVRTGRFRRSIRGAVVRYRRTFSSPGAVRFFLPGAVARLGVAMTGLAVLWAVRGASGSYGLAGLATGAFAVADAVVGPQVARGIDRWGQRRVVSVTATLFVIATIVLVLACAGRSPAWVLPALAGLAGATAPAVGALSAARWRHLLVSGPRLATALSIESALNDATFLVGPVLVTTLSAGIVPWAGLAMAAAAVAAGIAGLLSSRDTEPPADRGGERGLIDRRLLDQPFVVLFGANLAMGLFFGAAPVAITAFALAHGVGALAGPISAVSGVLSLIAGLVYGATGSRQPLPMMIVAGVVITVGAAALAVVPGVPAMFLGYGVVGGCVALILVPSAILLQRAVQAGVYTQAMTWMNSASAVGIAVAAPVVGILIQHHGWRWGFVGTGALTATLPVMLLITRRVLRPVAASPTAQRRSVIVSD